MRNCGAARMLRQDEALTHSFIHTE